MRFIINNLKKLTLCMGLGAFFVQNHTMHKAAAVLKVSNRAKLLLNPMRARLVYNVAQNQEEDFTPPDHIKDLIVKHQDLLSAFIKECQKDGLKREKLVSDSIIPGFFVKSRVSNRVERARFMQQYIDTNGIFTLAVPKKYKIKVSNRELVVAQAIDAKKITSLNRQEVKDLISFIDVTGYSDCHGRNIVRDDNSGKIYIIDTEGDNRPPYYKGRFYKFGVMFGRYFTPEALAYFKEYCEQNQIPK